MPTTNAGTLEQVALELGKALEPLGELLRPDVFDRLGLTMPRALSARPGIAAALTTAAAKAGQLPPRIQALAAAITGGDTGAIVSAVAPLLQTVGELVTELTDLGNTLHAEAQSGLTSAEKQAVEQFAADFAARTVEYSVVGYLDNRFPALTSAFSLIGLLDKEVVPGKGLEVRGLPPAVVPRRLYLDRLPKLFSHPDQYFQQVFRWGAPGFDGGPLFYKIQSLLEASGITSELLVLPGQAPILEAYFLSFQPDTSVSPPGLKVAFRLPASRTFDQVVPFSDLWKGTVHVQAEFIGGMEASLRPPFQLSVKPPSGNLKLDLLAGLKAEKSDPILLLGATGGTRLQVKSIGASVGVNIQVGSGGGPVASPSVQVRLDEGKLVIDFSQGDGFIQQILSGVRVEADFAIIGTWNPNDGLRLQGSGGVEIFIPLHINLALIELKGLYFSVGISTDAPLRIGVATQIGTNLGPLKAVVDRIGTTIPITFPEGGRGNLGLADIRFEFAAPTGVGLSLDGGGFKGGGFLSFNQEKGEYAGVLELEFQSLFSLKALGILNTKMPDGSEGFSLLIIILAEFPPIQLGFGFTLLGIGGLLGLNRTMVVERLAAGVKDGSLNYILFPQDIVANAPTIIASIGAVFPPKNGQFVFGPMGKLGWGTPTLISVELGLMIEVASPVRIAILGVIRCLLPEEHVPLIKLQVNFIGVIDFEKKELKFFASIFDSRLLAFTLAGDMALLISWGESANFVLSVGGFHPAFTPPPMGLPALSRLSISLLGGDNPRLRLEAYFAVTSNTVQFGAKLELYASVAIASIRGMLALDVLFQFSPFYFIARIQAALEAKIFDITLFAVALDFTLEGPTPWRAHGSATVSISFFFFDVSVTISFDITWGDRNDTTFPEITVLPKLKEALGDRRNWQALIPEDAHRQVSLRELPDIDKDALIVHPFGILTLSQKLVPLNQDIQLLGNQKVADASKTFRIDSVRDQHGTTLATENVREQFAPSSYFHMDDAQKLSRKAFEQLDSGVQLTGSNRFTMGAAAIRTVRYDFKYLVKKKLMRVKSKLMYLRSELFSALLLGNAVSQSPLSKASRTPSVLAPEAMAIHPEGFVVTSTDTLQAVSLSFDNESAAYGAMQQLVKDRPELGGKIQVVAGYQLAG